MQLGAAMVLICAAQACSGFVPGGLALSERAGSPGWARASMHGCGVARMRNLRGGCAAGAPPPGVRSAAMIFDGLFGKASSKETPGKFVRHGSLENAGAAFGPRGIVCAGLGEEELEVLAERVEQVLRGPDGQAGNIPITVLGREDMNDRTTLADVLAQMDERDSVLPEEPLQLKMPLILLSGLSPIQVSASIKAIQNSGIRGGVDGDLRQPMCAVAVPKAMAKTLNQLIEEIEGDALLNMDPQDR